MRLLITASTAILLLGSHASAKEGLFKWETAEKAPQRPTWATANQISVGEVSEIRTLYLSRLSA